VENVRLCRFCGHINSAEDTGRCDNCGAFSGLIVVSRSQGEEAARRKRFGLRRYRLFRLSLILAPIAVLAVWAAWFSGIVDLAPDPPRATSAISANAQAQTWAQVGRTPQNSGFTPEPAPVPQRVKWTYATAQPLISSPAVANDRVFLATEDGRTVALDPETGEAAWEYTSGLPSSSVPALAGDLVYFTLRPGSIVALERETGEVRWETTLEEPILTSPIVVDGALFIGSGDSKLHALDAVTGQELWDFGTVDWVTSPVAYGDGKVILTSQGSHIHVIDSRTGRQRLDYDTGRGRRAPAGPSVQSNLVYFGSYGGRVWAIDLQSKTRPWDRPLLFWQTNLYVWGVIGSPPVQRGSVWAVDIGGDVTEALAIAHDTVFATNLQGKVVALETNTGEERWSTWLENKITAAPTVAGDTVLIGTEEGIVFGLDAHTGEILWQFQTGGKITGSPIVAGGAIYIASHDGKLYAVTGSVSGSQ